MTKKLTSEILKKCTIVGALIGLGSALSLPVFAATTSASSSASASPAASASPTDDQVVGDLKQLIGNATKDHADQVKGAIDEMTLKKRGFIGEVERVIENTVTIKKIAGTTEVLNVDPTVVVMKDGKKATLDDVAVGDWVIALGYTDGQNFTLRRLVVSSTTLLPQSFDTVIGTAQSATKTELDLTPVTQTQAVTYVLDKNTHYEDDQGNSLKWSDIKKDSQYLVISSTDQDQKTAMFIKGLAASASAQLNGQ